MKKTFLLLLTGALLYAPVWAKIPSVPVSELVPSSKHEQATEAILKLVRNYHYKKRELNDQLSSEILDKYLEKLDPNRSFFTQKDIEIFETYRFELDDALKRSDLNPAFNIFKRYRQLIAERSEYALQILTNDFDFTVNENFKFDRRDTQWLSDSYALNEVWRKRVKNDSLPPNDASFSLAAAFFCSLVPQMQTSAPCSAKPSAKPSPIPPLPPVTKATLPVKSNISSLHSYPGHS